MKRDSQFNGDGQSSAPVTIRAQHDQASGLVAFLLSVGVTIAAASSDPTGVTLQVVPLGALAVGAVMLALKWTRRH